MGTKTTAIFKLCYPREKHLLENKLKDTQCTKFIHSIQVKKFDAKSVKLYTNHKLKKPISITEVILKRKTHCQACYIIL